MRKRFAILIMVFLLTLPVIAQADVWEEGDGFDEVYDILDEVGNRITSFNGRPEAGDEYISGDNKHYKVKAVDNEQKTATADNLGEFELPDVSWLGNDETLAVSSNREKKIAIYCTHSAESYVPSDGQTHAKIRGGIYDVADEFKAEMEKFGVMVEYGEDKHHPHDSGSYRRSRQTAVKLLKTGPDAIFDLHRDGIPNPNEYITYVAGENASKVRLLVGRSNQNSAANKDFATHIKAVGDKLYPGLIKDIYIGKGSYNQDLSPRGILLEFGTHTTSKERAINSTIPMAEVIYKALYGGITGAAGAASDINPSNETAGTNENVGIPSAENDSGAGRGILWVIGVFVIGLIVFAFIATGSKSETANKLKRNISEMTGGIFGKKPQK